jgi:acyl-CoA synthetase (AMP-forming)/AMP-acid ligase II
MDVRSQMRGAARYAAAELQAIRDELPELEHVLVPDSGYEDWLARRSIADPDPPIRGRNVMVEKFDPPSLLDLMQKEHIAYMFMVLTILNAINRIPVVEQRRFRDLKCMLASAAPISDETALKAHEIFGDAIYQGYGQTEVLSVATMGPHQWFARDVPGSQPSRLRHAAAFRRAADLGRGQDDPPVTAERIVDGWVKTGDIGRLDANGYLYMLDRADDMAISGSFNIYLAGLENVIAAHSAVVEVAAFGVPDERWEETPCTVVCVRPETSVTEKELVELCSVHLGNCKRPGKVVLRPDVLPKTPVGKIKRRDCASRSGRAASGGLQ